MAEGGLASGAGFTAWILSRKQGGRRPPDTLKLADEPAEPIHNVYSDIAQHPEAG